MDNQLRIDDICRILETSRKTGVAELTYCGLHVRFGRTVEEERAEQLATLNMNQEVARIPVTALTEKQHLSQNADALEQAELELREDMIAQMMIEAPEIAEQLIRDGELNDRDVGDTDETGE